MKEDATARTRANFEPQGDNLEDHAELRSESLQAISVVLLCPYCLTKHIRQLLQSVWSILMPHDSFPKCETSHCSSRGTEARFLQRHRYGSDTADFRWCPKGCPHSHPAFNTLGITGCVKKLNLEFRASIFQTVLRSKILI